jgi:hypothetical protein
VASFSSGLAPLNLNRKGESSMFGEIDGDLEFLHLGTRVSVEDAVKALLNVLENAKVVCLEQYSLALLVFAADVKFPDSGDFYVFDREKGIWMWIDFKDEAHAGYTEADFQTLVNRCGFRSLVEQPHLLREDQWILQPDVPPLSRLTGKNVGRIQRGKSPRA